MAKNHTLVVTGPACDAPGHDEDAGDAGGVGGKGNEAIVVGISIMRPADPWTGLRGLVRRLPEQPASVDPVADPGIGEPQEDRARQRRGAGRSEHGHRRGGDRVWRHGHDVVARSPGAR